MMALGGLLVLVWGLMAASTTLVLVLPAQTSSTLSSEAGALSALLQNQAVAGTTGAQVVVEVSPAPVGSSATALARRVGGSVVGVSDGRAAAALILNAYRGQRVVVLGGLRDRQVMVERLMGGDALLGETSGPLLIAVPRFSRPSLLSLGPP